MLPRYTGELLREIWSEHSKFYYWLLVELETLKVKREMGIIACHISDDLIDGIVIDPEEIARIEREVTQHDVLAFLQHVSPQLDNDEQRAELHRGMTSFDIGDTTLMLQLRRSLVEALIPGIEDLMAAVKDKALTYKYVPEIGRTHGVHAEPITFGVKMALWHDELSRHRQRLMRLVDAVSVGKLSGAVGMYVLEPEIERRVCVRLGLRPVLSTQIICRDIVSEYMTTLAIIHAGMEKMGLNIRLLAQTEIGEVKEPFGSKQGGSSAMPHKQNPIKAERVCGLGTVGWSYVVAALDNQAGCWHERSLDNSGSERVIIPDITILLDFEIRQLAGLIKGLRIFPEKMRKNLDATHGLVFSQEVMMLFAKKSGMPREEAHTIVRDIAIACIEQEKDFKQALLADETIMTRLTAEEIEACFSLENKLKYVDYIFEQAFGG